MLLCCVWWNLWYQIYYAMFGVKYNAINKFFISFCKSLLKKYYQHSSINISEVYEVLFAINYELTLYFIVYFIDKYISMKS